MKQLQLPITGRYLILPVRRGAEAGRMRLRAPGLPNREFDIELGGETGADYEVFADLGAEAAGAALELEYEGAAGLGGVRCAVQPPGAANLYRERLRPQFHFSSRRGWLNDPNGLVHYDGSYHLFYQHNPYGTEWGNMHWGHAVSSDLVHWRELPIALYPDALGTMFTGCAVVDHHNSSGLGSGAHPPIVLVYTAAGEHARPPTAYTQCLAFSADGGATWHKYDGNPVLPHQADGNRDPKVIWHAPSERWIMALYLKGTAYALFASPNLIDWERTCDLDLPGCTEVPDFFPLPVDDDPNDVRWVFWGANTTYLVGNFDGRSFTPQGGPRRLQHAGQHYAAQTFSDLPAEDGRRLMLGWMRQPLPGMPFSQFMSVPHTLHLRRRGGGEPELATAPARELEKLRESTWQAAGRQLPPGRALAADLTGELLDVEAVIELGAADTAGMTVRGVSAWYDRRTGWLFNGPHSGHLAPGLDAVTLRVLADRASVELFAGPAGSGSGGDAGPGGGAAPGPVMLAAGAALPPPEQTVRFFASGGEAVLRSARVSRLRSAWPPPVSA